MENQSNGVPDYLRDVFDAAHKVRDLLEKISSPSADPNEWHSLPEDFRIKASKVIDKNYMHPKLKHDLRAPITAVVGSISAFENVQFRTPRRIENASKMLQTFIWMMEGTAYSLHSEDWEEMPVVNVVDLFSQFSSLLETELKAPVVRFYIHGLTPEHQVKAPPGFVFNVLVNNIENAHRHGKCSIVNISVCADKTDVIISITGNGKQGIASADLPQIFKEGFTTSDSGQGLGLARIEALIQNLGGEVQVNPNGGEHGAAVFEYRFPLLTN